MSQNHRRDLPTQNRTGQIKSAGEKTRDNRIWEESKDGMDREYREGVARFQLSEKVLRKGAEHMESKIHSPRETRYG
jgi:hypothetical protein